MVEEVQIIEGCIKNDQQCKALLYKNYAPALYGVALRYTQRKEDAEDILHDAFLKIFDNIKQYSGKGSLLGWLSRIIINQAMDFHHQKPKAIFVDYGDYEEMIADETIIDPDKMTHKILLGFIKELPQMYQSMFNLCVIDGYSYDEAAKELRCTASECRTGLFRARNMLKRKVNNFLKEENQYDNGYNI